MTSIQLSIISFNISNWCKWNKLNHFKDEEDSIFCVQSETSLHAMSKWTLNHVVKITLKSIQLEVVESRRLVKSVLSWFTDGISSELWSILQIRIMSIHWQSCSTRTIELFLSLLWYFCPFLWIMITPYKAMIYFSFHQFCIHFVNGDAIKSRS